MSIQQVNNGNLLPEMELLKSDRNHSSQKLMLQVFPDAGSGPYGFSATNAIRQLNFTVGSQNAVWIPKESYLQYDINLATGTTGAIHCADAPFNRVRISTQTGVVLADSEQYNLFNKIQEQHLYGPNEQRACWEQGMQLQTADASVEQLSSSTRRYVVPLKSMMLRMLRSIPLPVTGQLKITIDLEQDLNAMLASASSATYRVNNPVLFVSLAPITSNFQQKLIEAAQAGGLVLCYLQAYRMGLPMNGNNNSFIIPFAAKSIQSVMLVPRLPAEFGSEIYDFFKTQSPLGGLSSIQVLQGSEAYPSSAIETVERAYVESKKAYNVYNDQDQTSQITRSNWTQAVNTGANQFVSSTWSPNISLSKNGSFTGVSTVNGPLIVRYNVVTASTAQMDVFVIFDTSVVVKSPTSIFVDI